MIDRGFIKWQPFNSLTPSKETLKIIEQNKSCHKPTLFPEEIKEISDTLIDAYYMQDIREITYYEKGKITTIKSNIKKINPNSKTIELGLAKTLTFNQIIHISS